MQVPPEDPATVCAVLERLDALLAQSDTAALRAALGAQAEQLGRAIGQFEFAAAREMLRTQLELKEAR